MVGPGSPEAADRGREVRGAAGGEVTGNAQAVIRLGGELLILTGNIAEQL